MTQKISKFKFLLATTSISLTISGFAGYAVAAPSTLLDQIKRGIELKAAKLPTMQPAARSAHALRTPVEIRGEIQGLNFELEKLKNGDDESWDDDAPTIDPEVQRARIDEVTRKLQDLQEQLTHSIEQEPLTPKTLTTSEQAALNRSKIAASNRNAEEAKRIEELSKKPTIAATQQKSQTVGFKSGDDHLDNALSRRRAALEDDDSNDTDEEIDDEFGSAQEIKPAALHLMPQPTARTNAVAEKLKAQKAAAILEVQQATELKKQQSDIERRDRNLAKQKEIENLTQDKSDTKATINTMLENIVSKHSKNKGTSNPDIVIKKISHNNQYESLHNLFASKSTEAANSNSTDHAAFKAKIIDLSPKFKEVKAAEGDTKSACDTDVSTTVAPPPPPPPPPPLQSSRPNTSIDDVRAKLNAAIKGGVALNKTSVVVAASQIIDNDPRAKLKKIPATPEEIAADNELRKAKLDAAIEKRRALEAAKAAAEPQESLGKSAEEVSAKKEAAKLAKEAKWEEARKANELAAQKMEKERAEAFAKKRREENEGLSSKNNAYSNLKSATTPATLSSLDSANGTQAGQDNVTFYLNKIASCSPEELTQFLDNLSISEMEIIFVEMEKYLKINGATPEEQAVYQAMYNSLQTAKDESLQRQEDDDIAQAIVNSLDDAAEAWESTYIAFSNSIATASIEDLVEQYDQFNGQDSIYRIFMEEMQAREPEKVVAVSEEVIGTAINDEAVEALSMDSRITLMKIINALELKTSAEVDAERETKLVETPTLLNTTHFVNEAIASAIDARIDFSIAVAQFEGIGAAAGDEDFGIKLKNLWFSGLYGSSTQGKNGSYAGYKSRMAGGTIGIDTEINEATLLGLAYSNISSSFNYKQNRAGDKTNTATHALSLYSQFNFNDAFIWNNIASVALSNIKTANKQHYSAVTHGKFKSHAFNFNTNLGYKIRSGDVLLIPNVGLRYGYSKDDAHTETGAGLQNARIAGRSSDLLMGSLGAKAVLGHKMDGGLSLMPSIHASVDFNLKNKVQKVKAQYAYTDKEINLAGATGAKTPKVSYNVGGGVVAQKNNIELALNYNLNMTKKYKAHQGSLKITVMF